MNKPHIFWTKLVTNNKSYKHIKQETKGAPSYGVLPRLVKLNAQDLGLLDAAFPPPSRPSNLEIL
jgi:hypothetical protein